MGAKTLLNEISPNFKYKSYIFCIFYVVGLTTVQIVIRLSFSALMSGDLR